MALEKVMGEVFYAHRQVNTTAMVLFAALVTVLLAVCAHVAGFKVYGRVELVENQPLHRPRRLVDISPDGSVLIEPGRRYFIDGIDIVRKSPLNDIRYFQWQRPTLQVEVQQPWQDTTRIDARLKVIWLDSHQQKYMFWPTTMNKYSKADLAEVLVIHGAAVPSVELFQQDPGYARRLMTRLRPRAAFLQVETNAHKVRQLSHFLMQDAEFFTVGAWLAVHCGDMHIDGLIEQQIENLLIKAGTSAKKPWKFTERMTELKAVLAAVNPNKARQMAAQLINGYNGKYPELKIELAVQLAAMNDWSGFDRLMEEVADRTLPGSYRRVLRAQLDQIFKYTTRTGVFAGHGDLMRKWYQENKSRFRWDTARNQVIMAGDSTA